jgi:hypothetical protein
LAIGALSACIYKSSLIGGRGQLVVGPPVSRIEMNTTPIAQFLRVDFGLAKRLKYFEERCLRSGG